MSGVYGGMVDPMPMLEIFDRGLTLRFGQCHVKRWTDDILGLLAEEQDVLGVEKLATHHLPLSAAPDAYRLFQAKDDSCLKVVFQP